MKFQIPRYKGLKVGIFRIRRIVSFFLPFMLLFETRHAISAFCIMRITKALINTAVTDDQRLCFASKEVQSIYSLNLKFEASCYLMLLYSAVCVGPRQKGFYIVAIIPKGDTLAFDTI